MRACQSAQSPAPSRTFTLVTPLPKVFFFFFAYEAGDLNTFYEANFCSKDGLWTDRKLSPLAELVFHVWWGTPEKPGVQDAVGADALSKPSSREHTPTSHLCECGSQGLKAGTFSEASILAYESEAGERWAPG